MPHFAHLLALYNTNNIPYKTYNSFKTTIVPSAVVCSIAVYYSFNFGSVDMRLRFNQDLADLLNKSCDLTLHLLSYHSCALTGYA